MFENLKARFQKLDKTSDNVVTINTTATTPKIQPIANPKAKFYNLQAKY
jgi:hypothetical protein